MSIAAAARQAGMHDLGVAAGGNTQPTRSIGHLAVRDGEIIAAAAADGISKIGVAAAAHGAIIVDGPIKANGVDTIRRVWGHAPAP